MLPANRFEIVACTSRPGWRCAAEYEHGASGCIAIENQAVIECDVAGVESARCYPVAAAGEGDSAGHVGDVTCKRKPIERI